MMSRTGLTLARKFYKAMQQHVSAVMPEEGCGLLAGRNGIVKTVIPITNVLHSPVRYNMHPKELIQAFYDFDAQGIDLVATFHSHPAGPTHPSETDLREYAYPEALMLIWAPEGSNWYLNGFKINSSGFEQIAIFVGETRNH